jgi:uncharacterized protein YjiS (DUF1127 family)
MKTTTSIHLTAYPGERAYPGLRALLAVARLLRGWGDALRQAYRNGQARDELANMSDRELADIGLNRGSIPAAFVRGSADWAGTYGFRRDPRD